MGTKITYRSYPHSHFIQASINKTMAKFIYMSGVQESNLKMIMHQKMNQHLKSCQPNMM